jgi:hypothetical protein
MNTEIPNKYIITYTNFLIFEGRKLAFRKKELFDISTNIPSHIPFNSIANCWLINRKQLTKSKAKELITMRPIEVDVTSFQWFVQEQLNHVFNL